jgi:hypothetical protein
MKEIKYRTKEIREYWEGDEWREDTARSGLFIHYFISPDNLKMLVRAHTDYSIFPEIKESSIKFVEEEGEVPDDWIDIGPRIPNNKYLEEDIEIGYKKILENYIFDDNAPYRYDTTFRLRFKECLKELKISSSLFEYKRAFEVLSEEDAKKIVECLEKKLELKAYYYIVSKNNDLYSGCVFAKDKDEAIIKAIEKEGEGEVLIFESREERDKTLNSFHQERYEKFKLMRNRARGNFRPL